MRKHISNKVHLIQTNHCYSIFMGIKKSPTRYQLGTYWSGSLAIEKEKKKKTEKYRT